jgi:hypothetical protein
LRTGDQEPQAEQGEDDPQKERHESGSADPVPDPNSFYQTEQTQQRKEDSQDSVSPFHY